MYTDTFFCGTLRGIQYFLFEADLTSPSALLRCLTHPAHAALTSHLSLIKALGDERTAQPHKATISHHRWFEELSCDFEFSVYSLCWCPEVFM